MDLLKEGQNLSIFFQKESNIVEMTCVISKVFDDRIDIDLPQYFMRYIEYLEVGSPLTVKVFTKVGTIDFNTVVISAPLEDDFSVEIDENAMKLTPKEDIPVIEDIETLHFSKDDKEYKASTIEISTEYIKITCDYDFKLNEILSCTLTLPYECGTIKFNGTVTYIDEVYYNEIKLSYSGMSEEDRQTLIYYMYLYSNNSD